MVVGGLGEADEGVSDALPVPGQPDDESTRAVAQPAPGVLAAVTEPVEPLLGTIPEPLRAVGDGVDHLLARAEEVVGEIARALPRVLPPGPVGRLVGHRHRRGATAARALLVGDLALEVVGGRAQRASRGRDRRRGLLPPPGEVLDVAPGPAPVEDAQHRGAARADVVGAARLVGQVRGHLAHERGVEALGDAHAPTCPVIASSTRAWAPVTR